MCVNLYWQLLLTTIFALLYPLLLADQNDTQIQGSENGEDLRNEWHQDNTILWLATFAFVAYLVFGFNLIAVAYVAAARGWHWVLFDAALNSFRGLDLGYVTADPKGAYSDRFLFRLGKHAVWFKVLVAALFTLLYIVSFNLYPSPCDTY